MGIRTQRNRFQTDLKSVRNRFFATVDPALQLSFVGNLASMGDQEFNLKLVGAVEKHEVLYNYRLPGYSRKDITEKAWQQVAAEMNTTAADCKDKWRNIRTVFLRKIKPPKSGSGATKKAYYLENAMQFCLPFVKTSAPPSSGNLPPVPLTGDEHEVGDPENCDDSVNVGESEAFPLHPVDPLPASTSQLSSSNAELGSPNDDGIAQQSQPMDRPLQPTRSIRTNKRALRTPAAQADASVAEYFAAKRARLEKTLEKEADGENPQRVDRQQSLKMFLLSLMPELLELSDSQIKLFKRRVFTLIDDVSKLQDQHRPPTSHSMFSTSSDSSHLSSMSHGSRAEQFYNSFLVTDLDE